MSVYCDGVGVCRVFVYCDSDGCHGMFLYTVMVWSVMSCVCVLSRGGVSCPVSVYCDRVGVMPCVFIHCDRVGVMSFVCIL